MQKHLRSILSLFTAATFLSVAVAQSPGQAPPLPQATAVEGRAQLNAYLDGIAKRDIDHRNAVVSAIHTRAEAEQRQAEVRRKILALIGPFPARSPLNIRRMGVIQADGFRIQKLVFDSQPGFHVPALLYVPDAEPPNRRLPAILISAGHLPSGKLSDYTAAAIFARNGFIVLSYDPIGQGERLQYPDPRDPNQSLATRPTGEHGLASLQPMLLGDSIDRYMLWDAIRAVDALTSFPQVDPTRIGAFGCSGGGAITALLGALDRRLAATAIACYITNFDTLLPAIGAQEGEQSLPHFIASGLDLPDWVELRAPRPTAVVSTYSDMFPFAGARASVIEARRFYSLFDRADSGSHHPTRQSVPATPTGVALNADTTDTISPTAALQFITGPGHHGALAPVMGDVLAFFTRNLHPFASSDHPILPPTTVPPGADWTPAALPLNALQVTPTGQIATSYPGAETVFSLNQKRAFEILPRTARHQTSRQLASTIRTVIETSVRPGPASFNTSLLTTKTGDITLPTTDGIDLHGELYVPHTSGRHPAVLLLVPNAISLDTPLARSDKAHFDSLAAAGNFVLAITPRPSPPGTEAMKSPILGPFYLLSLRADLVSRTLLGMRVDDVIRITDYLASRHDVSTISAVASGHMGLVLLHAAVLDPRLGHISIDHVLSSYRSLLNAPMPIGAPEDIIPGALLHYDLPDLVDSLGPRLTVNDPLQGTDDLSQTSTPLASLQH